MRSLPAIVAFVLVAGLMPIGAPAVAQNLTCADFSAQGVAQANLDSAPHDPNGLDPDGSGIACADHFGIDVPVSIAAATFPDNPLAARVGGDRATFEFVYGRPQHDPTFSDDDPIPFTVAYPGGAVFEVDGYFTVEPWFDPGTGLVLHVSLHSPRSLEDLAIFDRSADGDWTLTEAHARARRFLPRDAVIGEPVATGDQRFEVPCRSDALAAAVAPETYLLYAGAGVTGTPGDCHYQIWHHDEMVDAIDIGIGRIDVDRSAAPIALPTTDAATTTTSPDEAAYLASLRSDLEYLAESFITLGDLFEDPRFGDDLWTVQVVIVLVSWQLMYEEALTVAPPAQYSAMQAEYVEALRLLDAAADDFIRGLDTLNPALLEQGLARFDQASIILLGVTEQLIEAEQ